MRKKVYSPSRSIISSNRGRRRIAPTRNCTHPLKSLLNLFGCIKFFFLQFSFLDLIYSLGGYNMNKPAPSDHESNFKKGVAIPNEPKTQLLEILMIGTYIYINKNDL